MAYRALLCCLADSRGIVSKELAIPNLELGNLLIARDHKVFQPYCSTCACNLHPPFPSEQDILSIERSYHSWAAGEWASKIPESAGAELTLQMVLCCRNMASNHTQHWAGCLQRTSRYWTAALSKPHSKKADLFSSNSNVALVCKGTSVDVNWHPAKGKNCLQNAMQ